METNTFNKLFIFDINPNNDEITKELIFGKISSAIKKASANQYIVFLSHSNLPLLKKILIDINLKNVYVISDAGARIFDNKNDTIIYENKISKEIVGAVTHTGIIENDLVLVSSNTQEMAYSYNFINQQALSKKHFIKLACTNDFQKFVKFINTNDIYSIMIFSSEYERMFQSYEKFVKVSSEWNFELQGAIATYFLITKQNVNKSNAIRYLMDYLKISNNDNVHYYALNTYDKISLLTFKNRYVYQDVVLLSELKLKKFNFQMDINSLIRSVIKNSTN